MVQEARKDLENYPVARLSCYGPDAGCATKVAVRIIDRRGGDAAAAKTWQCAAGDIRQDSTINLEILAFLKEQGVRSVAISKGIIGCPHEEGIDYPAGETCPLCPYWADQEKRSGDAL